MKKVRAHYKGRYYYLGKAKNLEEELNLKRDFLRQVVIYLKKIQNYFAETLQLQTKP